MSVHDHPIPVMPAILMRLLDEIGRTRALHDEETDLVEILVNRGHRKSGLKVHWTPDLERALMRASHRPSGIRTFAAKHGVSENACYKRICVVKARRDGKLPRDRVKG
jgi:hypothetical protein